MSSLFNNLNNQQNNAQKSSLFSNLGSNNQSSSSSSAPSLFGSSNQPASTQPSSSLFGANTATNSAPQNGQPSQGKSLFDRITPADQPASSQDSTGPSLFAKAAPADPPASTQSNTGKSLFDRITPAEPQKSSQGTNDGGLFRGATSGPTQSQAQASGGLSGSAQPVGPTSLFGSTQAAPQPTAQPSSSFFGASLVNNNAGGSQQQSSGQVGQDGTRADGAPRTALFEDLLQRGRKRREPGGQEAQLGQLPSLQLGLGDISNRIKGLGSTKTSSSTARPGDTTAQYLLAASGVPRGATRRDLDAFSSQATGAAEPIPETFDPDLEKYMETLDRKTTKQLMEESFEQSKRDFNAFIEDHIQLNLEQQRQRIYEHFGLAKPGEHLGASTGARGSFGKSSRRQHRQGASARSKMGTSFNASAANRSVLGGSIARGPIRQDLFPDVSESFSAGGVPSALNDPFQRTKQERYAARVRELNISRLQEVAYPVVEQFARVEVESGSDTPKYLVDSYRALKEIVRENPNATQPSEPGAVRERQYAEKYLDENSNSGNTIAIRKQILEGSLKFLQESYFQQVEELVAKNPQEGNPGGRPSKIDKVRACIRIRAARKSLGVDNADLQMVNDDYCWVLIFYLLRCGLTKEAAQYVSENDRAIKTLDRHFGVYIGKYAEDPDRRLPRNYQDRMQSEYGQRAKFAEDASIDPYRMACYKIIGRCDLSRKTLEGVNATVDDLIWLYFSLARESSRLEEAAGETFGLEEVQTIIRQIGNRHFPPTKESGSGYATFFLMQILSGQFEDAIAWLYRYNYIAAVHFAIVLDFYGLLRVSDFAVSESALLSYNTRQKPQISFARLLGYYTRDFRLTRAEAATDYLCLICLNADLPGEAGRLQASVCHEALKELVLETREFAMLLGDVRADGQRVKGAIEQRLDLLHIDQRNQFLQSLTLQAAAAADDAGRVTDAVLLYHLADDYAKVLEIVNRALSDALSINLHEEPIRLQPLKPRVQPAPTEDGRSAQQQQQSLQDNSTLSLTSVDDPISLAQNISSLYQNGPPTSGRTNGSAYINQAAKLAYLLHLARVRSHVLSGNFDEVLDLAEAVSYFPLRARGDLNVIRGCAHSVNNADPVTARTMGPLLEWAVLAIGRVRRGLRMSEFGEARAPRLELLGQMARDCMVFAGLIKYKLGTGTMDRVVRAGQDEIGD